MVDEWAEEGKKNLFGKEVLVAEMQSEGGAAGALHGALSAGAFCSTFTASQGLLLMIPNMYKIAGELMPCVFHVSSRSLASHALSIFGDHQDVMATRATGFAILSSNSVQEVMDLALVAHLATIRGSIPFLHFFDGFRTSHEIQKVEEIEYKDIEKLIDYEKVSLHRKRSLNPRNPHLRGSAENPDIYFQNMEAANIFHEKLPDIVEEEMEKVFKLTNRKYNLFDYYGDANAKEVVIMMGSASETVEEVVDYLNGKGEKTGVLKVRLYRPFSKKHFLKALPKSVEKIAVLDRTKEDIPPLYADVCSIFLEEKENKTIVSGIYGLGSKEFTPPMVKAVFDNLKQENPKNHFTVGIKDDVTNRSLDIKDEIKINNKGTFKAMFWGLGGDGTVGANKEAIKIIGDNTNKYVQGYFSYDSKKSYGITVSHLRFGDKQIKSRYLIQSANYIACHHPSYVKKYDVLENIEEGGVFVLNSSWNLEELEKEIPNNMKKTIAAKKIKFYNIDAVAISESLTLGSRINMVMQTVFFKLSNIIPIEDAVKYLNDAITKAYGRKGEEIVDKNKKAVNLALENVREIKYPDSWADIKEEKEKIDEKRPAFIREVVDVINRGEGDSLPVSAFTPGGIFKTDTIKYEKRGLSTRLPEWIEKNCIQCNRCAFVCPHSVIRPFLMTEEEKAKAPSKYRGIKAVGKDLENYYFSIEISSMDCTGCGNCARECPAKEKALLMKPFKELYESERDLFEYAVSLKEKKSFFNKYSVKGSQFQKPLFEFSGACAGCGETPYLKLLTQLYGNKMIIANATGCTSIYGGTAISIPWSVDSKGCGPAWANSLFEDNAEYGFGMFLALKTRCHTLRENIEKALKENIKEELKTLFKSFLENIENEDEIVEISNKIIPLLEENKEGVLKEIYEEKDLLIKPSLWIIGGDGWAYDIGYGGLDHVLAMDEDVNMLVLDTEVYSNTGGQASKATPLGSIAKFTSSGKKTMKKDLGMMAMTYGNVYVASVSLGADQNQVVKAFKEAASYEGPSLIIAYCSCISHGIKKGMVEAQEEEKRAVECGYWFNYRFDPRLKKEGKNPFILDSKEPSLDLEEYLDGQVRYLYLKKKNPEEAKRLHEELKKHLKEKHEFFKKLSEEGQKI
jgi:pyruvate-ferredoxin/flavodoxin oxidoreductase